MPIDLRPYAAEVERGLPNEIVRMDEALERQAFYDYDGFRYEKYFRRDAESSFDFAGRSHRGSGFLRECVDKLTEHVYSPGPARCWSHEGGDEFLQKVYADNFMDALMLEADKLSTLNEYVALQIDAGRGDFRRKPITFRLWGREENCVWCDPGNANVAQVVCTRDKYDLQTRYRLWSDTQVQTFLTNKADEKGVIRSGSDGRVAYPVGPPENHNYGILPFSFVHYALPIRTFDITSIGEFLTKAEIHIDDRLARMDESIHKHLNPIPWAKGMPDRWKPDIEPGRFIKLPPRAPRLAAGGGYEPGEYAELGYLQVTIDSQSAWDDLLKYINQCLEAAGVPLSAVRMEQTGVASGIALIVEQEPLLKRAETRRPMFRVYETDIAQRTLMCAGNHYGIPMLVSAADEGILGLSWPQPRLAVNTPDKLELLTGEVNAGLKSELMAVQDWYGINRDDALRLMEQIEEDRIALESIRGDSSSMVLPRVMPSPKDEPGPGGDEPTQVPAEEKPVA
jgi:hypothetical protein